MFEKMLNEPWAKSSLRKAIEELERTPHVPADGRRNELYEARLDRVRVLATMLRDWHERGLTVGQAWARGDIETVRNEARRLLQDTETPETVARLTRLPLEEVQSL